MLWLWILLAVFGAVVVVGVLAAIAVPSFTKYQQHSKRIEAELYLNRIQKAAKQAYYENGAFPSGSAEPTPPLGSCCAGPGRKCAPDPRVWAGVEPWATLDFEMTDPHYFSYSYEGSADGQRFTARAHGDLDCDGDYVVYELIGTANNGNPEITLVKPTRPD